ncbi:glycosyltransferase family 39 protein [Asticcacaulis sp. BYS171W]|uniref:Glycosyltransferase family 39 protein n=1 Tax=Asticcacaulis aquaticus TaxID=2984212 RepID=A0ABT5HXI2_9CAUL|nr:glycosyltransferase family 39 protein [Asticcacaulis aquaticus]MDC7684779.1 glycosyltransferase family 39 protein [Asticcacaulis aquaticus]
MSTAARYVLWGLGLLFVLRVALLFTTYTNLYPDEAQYWLWSRELDFGYYSKPPMIAWLIHLSTLFGDREPFVRLFAPFLHLGAALFLWGAGKKLFDERTGLTAAVIYSVMPGVVLSSAVISTDAALMFFLAATLYFYSLFLTSDSERDRTRAVLGMGLMFGCAALSKYACVYFLIGAAAHALFAPSVRQRWSWPRLALFLGAFILLLSPNLYWNATHGFQTVSHTADNANWHWGKLFNPLSLLKFWRDQFGVFGPVPFAILILAFAGLFWRRGPVLQRDTASDLRTALIGVACLTAPPLVFVSIQAFLSRANANWAASAYVPASLLVAALVWHGFYVAVRTHRLSRWAVIAGATFQVAVMTVFMVGVVSPELSRTLGLGNTVKRARAWDTTTQALIAAAQAGPAPSAIAVDNRNVYNAVAYYGRDWFAAHPDTPLKAWVREAHPKSQAETETPLTETVGQDVLILSYVDGFLPDIRHDFISTGNAESLKIAIDHKRTRDFTLLRGYGFKRAPRDPITGHPVGAGVVQEDEAE